MDLDSLYKDLFKKYTSQSSDFANDVRKVSDYLTKNQKAVMEELEKLEGNSINESYIPYPEYDDENFNKKIYQKTEFNRHFQNNETVDYKKADFDDLSKAKCSQTTFKLTPNQKFIKNFMSPLTPYNGLLLFHSVGVGKTCTAISIAEQYHQLHQKPVLVILSGTLIDNFKKQLFDITKYDVITNESNLCTGTTYPDLILDKTLIKTDVLEKNINKIISQRYKFIGYKKLVSIYQQTRDKVAKQEKDVSKHEKLFQDKIKEYFSDRLIIIDEAHHLRNSSEKSTKQTAQIFYSLLKYTENVKLVLLTATPMFNNANEIVWLLNLLLTNDKRPNIKMSDVFDKMGALAPHGKKKLIEAARGYVSYMRGENPFSFPFRLYPSINNDKKLIKKYPTIDITSKKIRDEDMIKYLEIIGSDMSEYQRSVYNIYKRKVILDEGEEEGEEDLNVSPGDDTEKMPNDLHSILQISNIVYPVDDIQDTMEAKKTFGTGGFDNTFSNVAKKGAKYRYTNECLHKHGEILTYDKLNTYAPKIKSIIDYIMKSKGIVFIYSNYYASGIKPLAIALEHIGFMKYNTNNITGDSITLDDKYKGKKRPSYVIISRDSDLSPNNDREIEMIKSKDNINGDIVKVVLASSIASEGIDFKRIREVHILEPWYNLNRTEQIVGRAVRQCSHIDMPKEDRNVTIYFHASKYNDNEESIDIRTYRIAEKKQKRITEVERIMKESSFDCNLNKNSLTYNVKDLNMKIPVITSQGTKINDYSVGDRDFSYVCNYAKCELTCNPDIASKKVKLDESTYNTRFIMDDVTLYQRYVAQLYKGEKKAFTYTRIVELLTETYKIVDEEVLQYALQDMLDDKTVLYDIDGVRGYLIYRSNKYMFQSSLNHDRRMTIEQRETPSHIKNRVKLDLSALKAKISKENSEKQLTNASQKETKNNDVDDVVLKNACNHMEESFVAMMKLYKGFGVDIGKYDKYVIDSIIDRLSNRNLLKLVQEVALLYNNGKIQQSSEVIKSCLRSFVEADVVIVHDDKIMYFYNHYDGEMYCLRTDGDFKKCSPLDLTKVNKQVAEIKKKMRNELEDTIKGHIEVTSKLGGGDFKVRDNPKSSGYVCWKTSALSLNDLRERIIQFDTKLKKGIDNMIKKDMSLVYELTLRAQGRKLFKRSVVKKLK